MLIQKLRQTTVVMLALVLLMLGSPIAALADTNDIQDQVLQVIQDHPQAILDSLVQYQQHQEQRQAQTQTATLTHYQQNPSSLIGRSPVLGRRGSGRVVVEFSDFQCPFCEQAHKDLAEFHRRNPDVLVAYKHLPLVQIHGEAMPAAQASWAALQQGKFWEYHDQLFAHQATLSDELYQRIAQDLKLNMAQFEHDRRSDASTKAIADDLKVADTVGAQGTPMFIVIGKKAAQIVAGAGIGDIEAALKQV
jgi:protein-disulfide isomerase